jgi:hypothetical protein
VATDETATWRDLMSDATEVRDGNCGPGAIAAICGLTLDDLRPHLGDFEQKRYTTFDDNLRAIALSLEALRAVDRYGVTKRGEQYKGFAQLPAPEAAPASMDVETAARVLAGHTFNIPAAAILRDRADYEQALRCAQRAAHPDAGGNHEAFVRVQQARGVLERHHGGGQ